MTDPAGGTDRGPGILETGLVLGGALLVAAIIVLAFGGVLADAVAALMDAAHGGG